ncbi:hypothetical protein DSO57_1024704 [Entomophthora muscae]|uniref:Uncharacterized protein n=1 Tax=Entomophthora muscae TaxID=34485 RepID=A0ACC2T2U6_9FUNG|nr:hypothetical protein DSO57_1024704 [Entomophthora muscae]
MFPFARVQLRRLTLQGNPFSEKLAKVNYNISKALNRSAGISKSPGAVQCFSSWRGRPYNSQSSFRRKYNALGSKVDNIDPNTLVYGIIGANLAVFGCIQFAMVERDPFKLQKVRRFIHDNLAFSNLNLKMGRVWTIVTAGFTHENFWHLLFNSMTIYFFGPTLAASLGNRRFLGLYMLSGISANVLTSVYHKTSHNQLVSASGITRGDLISSIGVRYPGDKT